MKTGTYKSTHHKVFNRSGSNFWLTLKVLYLINLSEGVLSRINPKSLFYKLKLVGNGESLFIKQSNLKMTEVFTLFTLFFEHLYLLC